MRHPQDFIRARVDKIFVPWTRTEGTDIQIVLTVEGSQYINGALINLFGVNGIEPYTRADLGLLLLAEDDISSFALEDESGNLLLE